MKHYSLFFFCIFFVSLLSAQQRRIDSLKNTVKNFKDDTAKVRLLNSISKSLLDQNKFDESIIYSEQAYKLAGKINDENGEAAALLFHGKCEDSKSNFDTAIAFYNRALEICKRTKNNLLIGKLQIGIGNAYDYKNNCNKAMEHYMLAQRSFELASDSSGIAGSYIGIGNSYFEMKIFDKTLENFSHAEEIYKRKKDDKMLSWLYTNIGSTYYGMRDTNKAMEFFFLSVKMKKRLNDNYGLSTTYNNLSDIYSKRGNYSEALKYALLSYEIRVKINDIHEVESAGNYVGSVYLDMNEYAKATEYFQRSAETAKKLRSYDVMAIAYNGISRAYSGAGDFKNALMYHKLYTDAKDSLLNNQNSKQINELSVQYETEKKNKELLKKDSEIKIQEADSKQKSLQRNAFIIGFVLMLGLAFFIFRSFRLKQKANVEISFQKAIIEEKNKDITDSINYAKRIQDAILPDKETKYRLFPEAFVLFQPKDIVSGDFYWFTEKNGKKIIAAVDCTGHGVPGAFMSMIGNSFLNEIVNEKGITKPAEILNQLRENIVKSLKQKGETGENRDGMDISILSFPMTEGISEVEWAGANNPLWIIRNGDVKEFTGDKQPVGFQNRESFPFNDHKIELQKGDSLYIFTDGYADQFGGPKGKKFKYKHLQEVLLSIQNKKMNEQEKILLDVLNEWKNWPDKNGATINFEQVDDILMIGIKV